jgi:hypothetical protein
MSRYTGSPMISIAPFVALLDLERNCRHCCLDLLEMSGDPHRDAPRAQASYQRCASAFPPRLSASFDLCARKADPWWPG